MRKVQVYVLLPPQLLLLDLAGPLEVLRRANHVQPGVQFEVRYVGPAASMRTSIGLAVTDIEPLPGRVPPGAILPSVTNAPPSPLRQYPRSSKKRIVLMEKAS